MNVSTVSAFTHQPRCFLTVAGFQFEGGGFISEYPASLSRCFQVTENMMFGDRLKALLMSKKVKRKAGQRESASLLHVKDSFMENKSAISFG